MNLFFCFWTKRVDLSFLSSCFHLTLTRILSDLTHTIFSAETAVSRKNLRCLGWRTVNPGTGKVKWIQQNCFGMPFCSPKEKDFRKGCRFWVVVFFVRGEINWMKNILTSLWVWDFKGTWVILRDPRQTTTCWPFDKSPPVFPFCWAKKNRTKTCKKTLNMTDPNHGWWWGSLPGLLVPTQSPSWQKKILKKLPKGAFWCLMKQFWPDVPSISNISNLRENLPAMKPWKRRSR